MIFIGTANQRGAHKTYYSDYTALLTFTTHTSVEEIWTLHSEICNNSTNRNNHSTRYRHIMMMTDKATMSDDGLNFLKATAATNHRSTGMQSDMVMLDEEFTPGDWDVICQRGEFTIMSENVVLTTRIAMHLTLTCHCVSTGKDSFEHVGNKRFRKCIDDHIQIYMKATSRQEKSNIVSKIYDQVKSRASKPKGGFIKKVRQTPHITLHPFWMILQASGLTYIFHRLSLFRIFSHEDGFKSPRKKQETKLDRRSEMRSS